MAFVHSTVLVPLAAIVHRHFALTERVDYHVLVVACQASVELPPLDADAADLRDCYAPAMHWADVFWNTCLHRCTLLITLHAEQPGLSAEMLFDYSIL